MFKVEVDSRMVAGVLYGAVCVCVGSGSTVENKSGVVLLCSIGVFYGNICYDLSGNILLVYPK